MRSKLVPLLIFILTATIAIGAASLAMAQQQDEAKSVAVATTADQAAADAYYTSGMTAKVKKAIGKTIGNGAKATALLDAILANPEVLANPASASEEVGKQISLRMKDVSPDEAKKDVDKFVSDAEVQKKMWINLGVDDSTVSQLKPLVEKNPTLAVPLLAGIASDLSFERKFKGTINAKDEPGLLGIPGAPSVGYLWGLLWAVWVGWIFSTVGAFGGIMAGVGHITIFGFGDYASKFGKDAPMNKLVTDSIRVSNQWLVGLSAFIGAINYYRMGRLVAPLGICLAVGGVAGSWLVPAISAGKVSLKDYIGYFGLCVLLLGFMLLRDLTSKGQAKQKKAKASAAAFEKAVAEGGDLSDQGVKIIKGSWSIMIAALLCVVASALVYKFFANQKLDAWVDPWFWIAVCLAAVGWLLTFLIGKVKFSFFGVEFEFKAYIPMLGGIVIAALASFLGVGGGFLFVPFLTSVAGLPMFLVAGTSGLVVLVGMIVSIFTYMVGKGVVVEWGLIGAELIGIFIGSMIGPRTSKFIPDKWLRIIFIVLAFYVGLRYSFKGLFGLAILPPF